MKNLALALAMTVLLAACSSGTTVAPLPVTLTGVYVGTFENTEGTQNGSATFNLSQAENDPDVNGNAIFETTGRNTCLINGTVNGTNNGPNATLTIAGVNFQLAISDNGNTLSGTYVITATSDECSSESGSGMITLRR